MMLLKQQVKTEAARSRMNFAEQIAEMKKHKAELDEKEVLDMAQSTRKKAELETDLHLLEQKQEIAEAEAKFKL